MGGGPEGQRGLHRSSGQAFGGAVTPEWTKPITSSSDFEQTQDLMVQLCFQGHEKFQMCYQQADLNISALSTTKMTDMSCRDESETSQGNVRPPYTLAWALPAEVGSGMGGPPAWVPNTAGRDP